MVDFVDREAELRELNALLENPRAQLLIVARPAASGKDATAAPLG